MGLRFLTGRAGCGKTARVIDEIGELIEQKTDKTLILIVPELYTLQAEQDIINALNIDGFMNVEVLSFKRLANKVFESTGTINKTYVDDQGKCMALRRVIEQCVKELNVFMRASNKDGFITEVSHLVRECKKSDVYPEQMMDLATKMQTENAMLSNKLHDFSLIYSQLNQYLGIKYYDDEDAFNWLIQQLPQAPLLHNTLIWIDGFDVFTQQTYRIIQQLATVAEEVTVSLPQGKHGDHDGEIFEGFNQAKKAIAEKMKERHIPVVEEHIELKRMLQHSSPELLHIEKQFFSYPCQSYNQPCNDIQILLEKNPRSEVEACAIELVRLAREENLRWNEIAVIVGNMTQYKTLICRVFDRYNITYFIDSRQKVMSHPVIQLVLASLRAVSGNFQFDDMFQYLKTGFSGASEEEIERLENYCIRYGVRGSKWKRPFYQDEYDLERIELDVTRECVMEGLSSLIKAHKKALNGKQIAEAIVTYLEDLNVRDKIELSVEAARQAGDFERANIDAQVWNSIMKTLDQFAEIVGDKVVTFDDTVRILETGFETLELGVIPSTLDQVVISSPERFKSRNVRVLYILGCNDGVIPLEESDSAVLDGSERDVLKEQGIHLGGGKEDKGVRSNYLLYSLLSRPTKRLILSRPIADDEGRALRPSYIIGRFTMLFPQLKEQSGCLTDQGLNQVAITTPAATFKHLSDILRDYLDGEAIADEWREVYGWYNADDEWHDKVTTLIKGAAYSGKTVQLANKQMGALYGDPFKASVSRIEQYAQCPFAHFARFALRPVPRLAYEVEATDVGTLFHEAIDRFLKEVEQQKMDWDDVTQDVCKEIAERVIKEQSQVVHAGVFESSEANKYIQKRLIATTADVMMTVATHIQSGNFMPAGTELGFGEKGHLPAIELKLAKGEKVLVEGRVDRIDTLERDDNEYIKIIDYKSGKKTFSLADVYRGTDIQLMLYMNALIKAGEGSEKKSIPAGVFYFNISDKMIETFSRNSQEIDTERELRNKMNGLVLSDADIANDIDRNLSIKGKSTVIPVALKKDGSFNAYSSVANEEEFKTCMTYVDTIAKQMCESILNGENQITPIKYPNGQSACQYCDYKSICQFDGKIMSEQYREAETVRKKDEIIAKMIDVCKASDDKGGEV